MNDPYSVLGVSRNASDDEIKKAYRALVRKYHPDKNPGNKAAEEMFVIVQEAYDSIMNERKNGYSGSSYSGSYSYGYGGSYSGGYGGGQQSSSYSGSDASYYQAAANYINSRHFQEALNVLSNIRDRSAQWYYFSAVANSGLGNNYAALEQAQTAYSMEPGNFMYANLVNALKNGGSNYQNMNQPYGSNTMFDDNFCMRLCAMQMLCNVCDGDCCCCC